MSFLSLTEELYRSGATVEGLGDLEICPVWTVGVRLQEDSLEV
jgi:hypothetical protein